MAVFEGVLLKDLKALLEHGFGYAEPRGQYERKRMQGPCVLILYMSGKLVVQGSDDAVAKTSRLLARLKIGKRKEEISLKSMKGVIIGSDETLKGDTFVGLVVAGVRADEHERKVLVSFGVTDSKKMTDAQVARVAEQIKENVHFSIQSLTPLQYNKRVDELGLTGLMNAMHAAVADDLHGELGAKHIVDKYPGCKVGDIIETKADARYVEVAAASIIARDEGLKQLRRLSGQLHFPVPKGSTHVAECLDFLKKSKQDPRKFVKIQFKNVKKKLNV